MSQHVQQEHRVATAGFDDGSDDGGASSRSFGISYESLQRVVQQLENYPHRRQWTLELGSEWNVERVGDVLRMTRGDATTVVGVGGSNSSSSSSSSSSSNTKDKDNSSSNNRSAERVWEWTRVVLSGDEASIPQATDQNTNCHQLQIQVPSDLFEDLSNDNSLGRHLELASTTLREAEASAKHETNNHKHQDEDANDKNGAAPQWLRFVPPWKKSDHTHTSSPVKLRAFLRGQKVPVHLRDTTPLLFLESGGDSTARQRQRHLIAVCVRDNWIISKEFHVDAGNDYDAGTFRSDLATAEMGNRVILNLTRTR
jgi:hypothetical protein